MDLYMDEESFVICDTPFGFIVYQNYKEMPT